MPDWPKPLDVMTSPLCLELPVVCLRDKTGVLCLPPSLPPCLHLHRCGAVSWAEPAAPRELLRQRVGSDRARAHLLCFCKQPENICSVPARQRRHNPEDNAGWLGGGSSVWGHPHPNPCPDDTRFQAKSPSWVCAFVIPVVIIFASREGFGWVN